MIKQPDNTFRLTLYTFSRYAVFKIKYISEYICYKINESIWRTQDKISGDEKSATSF